MSLNLTIKLALLAVLALLVTAALFITLYQRFHRRKPEPSFETQRPGTIHLERLVSGEWSRPHKISRSVQAFRKLGFRAIGSFRVPEIPDLRLVALGHPADRLGAIVFENADLEVSCEVIARYANGGTLMVRAGLEDWPSGQPHHEKIFLKKNSTPKHLCKVLFENLLSEDLLPIHPQNFVPFFESAYAEEAAWRREQEGPRETVLRDPELDGLSEPLFQRIKTRDLAGVQEFLGLGFSPEGRDLEGRTLLMAAVITGEASLVRTLLDAGADPNARAPGAPGTPFVDAAQRVARSRAEALVTPLTLAIETGIPEIVTALLQAGANFEGARIPPFHFACQEGDLDMVRTLVEGGADVHQEDEDGLRPIHFAAIEGHVEIVEYLVSAGADPNARYGKETPAALAAAAGSRDVVEVLEPYLRPREVKRARRVLEDAAPIGNVRARRLMNAAMNGRTTMVRKLLASGLGPDALEHENGDESATALMLATQGGHVETMRALIEAGADVNREDDGGEPIITRALTTQFMEDRSQQGEAIRLLVRHSADLSRLGAEERALVDRFVNERNASGEMASGHGEPSDPQAAQGV